MDKKLVHKQQMKPSNTKGKPPFLGGLSFDDLVPTESSSDDINLICVWNYGKFINRGSFNNVMRDVRCDLGIKFETHSLRHSHVTMLAENGVNPKNLQTRLGHNHIQTTLQTYVQDTEKLSTNTLAPVH